MASATARTRISITSEKVESTRPSNIGCTVLLRDSGVRERLESEITGGLFDDLLTWPVNDQMFV